MNAATISTVVISLIALISAALAIVGWVYRRGQDEQKLAGSVEKHAEATELLAEQVGGLRDTLQEHSRTLTDHHYRLKALEERRVEVTVK